MAETKSDTYPRLTASEYHERAEQLIERLRATAGFDEKHVEERIAVVQVRCLHDPQFGGWQPAHDWIGRYLQRERQSDWRASVRQAVLRGTLLPAERERLIQQGQSASIGDPTVYIDTTLASYADARVDKEALPEHPPTSEGLKAVLLLAKWDLKWNGTAGRRPAGVMAMQSGSRAKGSPATR